MALPAEKARYTFADCLTRTNQAQPLCQHLPGLPRHARRAGHQRGPGRPYMAAAEQAAERTGEGVGDFVARAVETQAQRDKSSLRLGINPATGGKLKKDLWEQSIPSGHSWP